MTTITSHGLNFNVEADGFVRAHAEADRDVGIEAIRQFLDGLDAETVRAAHATSLAWIAGDCDGERPMIFDMIEDIGHAAATEGWHDATAVSFSVSAAR